MLESDSCQLRIKSRRGSYSVESIEVVETFFSKVWNERRLDLLQEIIDPKCVTHQVRSAPGPIDAAERGPLALKEHIESWLAAFPDITASLDLRCACGTDVISWVTMRGTHRRAWQGVPATGREVTIRTVAHHRVENGRIIEDWVIVETLGFFQQLGVVAPTQELLAQQTRAVT
jgi:predicted ester cyclase